MQQQQRRRIMIYIVSYILYILYQYPDFCRSCYFRPRKSYKVYVPSSGVLLLLHYLMLLLCAAAAAAAALVASAMTYHICTILIYQYDP